MSTELFSQIDAYIESLFIEHDPVLAQGLTDAAAAGLPEIQVSANQGRLLYLLTKMSGARRVLEIGTLGGYSTTWLARAVVGHGMVTTLELEEKHADVARKNIRRAGLEAEVTIEVGPAAATLQRFIDEDAEPFDLIFIDADKTAYSIYLDLSLRLSRPGTVIIADNLIRNGAVMDAAVEDENARAARAFNQKLAVHRRLESLILPIARKTIDGMSISIVRA
jgi:caffeoyl-CoA O-methyltransferase